MKVTWYLSCPFLTEHIVLLRIIQALILSNYIAWIGLRSSLSDELIPLVSLMLLESTSGTSLDGRNSSFLQRAAAVIVSLKFRLSLETKPAHSWRVSTSTFVVTFHFPILAARTAMAIMFISISSSFCVSNFCSTITQCHYVYLFGQKFKAASSSCVRWQEIQAILKLCFDHQLTFLFFSSTSALLPRFRRW